MIEKLIVKALWIICHITIVSLVGLIMWWKFSPIDLPEIAWVMLFGYLAFSLTFWLECGMSNLLDELKAKIG